MIFVSPRIIDPAGNPIHTEENWPYDPNTSPSQDPVLGNTARNWWVRKPLAALDKQMRLLIIDGHAFAYRAFFAIRDLSSPSGQPTNAIYGFINMLKICL